MPQTNGFLNGAKDSNSEELEESIYHLPPGMQDLLQSFEATQQRVCSSSSQANQRMLEVSKVSSKFRIRTELLESCGDCLILS